MDHALDTALTRLELAIFDLLARFDARGAECGMLTAALTAARDGMDAAAEEIRAAISADADAMTGTD